jgi:hypothetical protein
MTTGTRRGRAGSGAKGRGAGPRKPRRGAQKKKARAEIPADGLIPCPRCGQRWPLLHDIHDENGAVVERACDACIFDDVYAGRVKLRRKDAQP